DFMKLTAAGVVGTSSSGWMRVLANRVAETQAKTKACILLYMEGGASHKDTFDLKPKSSGAGEFKPIQTSVSGIEISEHLPKIAKQMEHTAVIRGMSTSEGAHGRAKYYMHTGYREGVGGLVYPSIGSITSAELGDPKFPLPNFVVVGNRSYGAGFLGARHQPIIITHPQKGVENLKPLTDQKQFDNRVGLLEEMEKAFHRETNADAASDHKTTYERAVTLMKSKEAKAFDLSLEKSETKAAYGATKFGEGCLLARRLVE